MIEGPLDWDGFVRAASALGVRLDDAQTERLRRMLDVLRASNAAASLTSGAGLADALRVHLLDALTLVPFIRDRGLEAGRLVDVGAGGGFPGLVLKIAVPSLSLVLIEASRRKTEYLRRVAAEIGVEAAAHWRRAEAAGRDPVLRASFDLATARALGPWPVVLELALPLCRVNGVLLGQRGPGGPDEAREGRAAAELLGGRIDRVERVGGDPGLGGRHVIVVEKVGPTPARYPRRTGIPAKRPLG